MFRTAPIVFLLSWTSLNSWAQPLIPQFLTDLPTELNEVSGTILIGDALWGLGDSGSPNAIFRFDPANGAILQTVTITNATNTDWEEMTTDGSWVFIGDFGNNLGSRTDLRVYRFPVSSLENVVNTEVLAEVINFSYADQTDFTPVFDGTNWDCEAFIAMDDSLFLFTKNWVDQRAFLYAVSAEPGTHSAVRKDSLDTQGLITGAALDLASNAIALIGYTTGGQPFVWQLSGFDDHDFFGATALRRDIDLASVQTESIVWSATDTILFTHENSLNTSARLWSLYLDLDLSIGSGNDEQVALFRQVGDEVIVSGSLLNARVQVLAMDGRMVIDAIPRDGRLSTDGLAPGPYLFTLIQDGAVRGSVLPIGFAQVGSW